MTATLNGEQGAVDQVEGRVEGFVHEVEDPLFIALFVIFLPFGVADEIQHLEGARIGVVDFDGVDERCLIVVWLIDLDEQAVGQGFVGVLGKKRFRCPVLFDTCRAMSPMKTKPISECRPTIRIENGRANARTPVIAKTRKLKAVSRDMVLRF